MDELTLFRSTRDLTSEPSTEALIRGEHALQARIVESAPITLPHEAGRSAPSRPMLSPRGRRRKAAWAGLSVLGAAGATAVLVATDVLGVAGWNGGATPAAASVLESAAVATLDTTDPVVGPGQYLFVRTDGAFAAVGTLEEDADRIRQQGGDVQPSDDVSMIESYHDELYVPADRNETWIWVQCTRTPLQTFGPRSEAFAAEQSAILNEYDTPTIREFPGGTTLSGSNFGGYDVGATMSVDYDALPRDPDALLDKIYELNGSAGQSRDGQALEWITGALERGTAPADFRAALYKTAAKIPGVEITEDQATLDGTTGIAIGRVEPADSVRHDIIINPETGQFIGEREVTLKGYASFPAGTTTSWTTVTTSVSTSAPTDTTTCGS